MREEGVSTCPCGSGYGPSWHTKRGIPFCAHASRIKKKARATQPSYLHRDRSGEIARRKAREAFESVYIPEYEEP